LQGRIHLNERRDYTMGIPKRIGVLTLVVLAIVLSLAGCRGTTESPAPVTRAPTKDEDVAAIKARLARYVAAFNARDAAAIVALETDDALFMAPDEPIVVGKKAIKAWRQAEMDWITKELTAASYTSGLEEIEVTGDWAFSRGTYTFTGTSKAGGKPTQFNGKFIHILKRQPDGSWKLTHDCWNRNEPLPSASK
jgi:ketosteroid isomerase-like protein